MDISGSRILLLGGAGLVGMAITRRLLKHHRPKTIIITSLFENEVKQAISELEPRKIGCCTSACCTHHVSQCREFVVKAEVNVRNIRLRHVESQLGGLVQDRLRHHLVRAEFKHKPAGSQLFVKLSRNAGTQHDHGADQLGVVN